MHATIACMKQLDYALTLPPCMPKGLKVSSYSWGKTVYINVYLHVNLTLLKAKIENKYN